MTAAFDVAMAAYIAKGLEEAGKRWKDPNKPDEKDVFNPGWEQVTLLWFDHGGGNWAGTGTQFSDTKIEYHGTPFAVANFERKVVLFRNLMPIPDGTPAIRTRFEQMIFQEYREPYNNPSAWRWDGLSTSREACSFTFVPVITMPHHPINVDYLKESIDKAFVLLVRKRTKLKERSEQWRKLEATYEAYHRFHGLECEVESLPERLARLKLESGFAKLLTRTLTAA